MADGSEDQQTHFSQEELRFLKTQYNRAKELLDKISGLSSKYESTAAVLKSHEEEIDKLSTDAKEKLNSVENAKTESANGVLEIKSNLEKVQSEIAKLEEALQRFENVRGKIESKDGEIEALSANANGLKQDIENLKATAQQRLQEIETIFVQVQENLSKVQEVYSTFQLLNEKFGDENTGLQAILNQATELQTKSKAVFQEINSFRDDSKAQLDLIEANRKATDSLKDEIQANLDQTILDRDEVASITALITDTGFANAFQEREKKLSKSSNWWLGLFIVGVAALALLLYHFFGKTNEVPGIDVVLYRLTLTSPLLILIGFAASQYRHDRSLTEKYAFKAVIAAVIRNHTKFLTDLKDSASEDTIGFARQTIENIYKEPYLKESKTVVNGNGKKKKLNLREMVESARELRDLVPNDESLKEIIDLMIKLR